MPRRRMQEKGLWVEEHNNIPRVVKGASPAAYEMMKEFLESRLNKTKDLLVKAGSEENVRRLQGSAITLADLLKWWISAEEKK